MPDADVTNILVVDDLPEKRLVYDAVLEELGENIISVTSGAEALKQVLQQDFAVILLDVNMPGIDGFETARLIRQRKRSGNTPIIFLTAFADEVRTAEGYASGAVDYLPTPVVPEILRAKVRVFVELFKMRRQVAQQAEEKARHAAAEEANRRLSFLAEAGAILGRSLNFDATARDIVRAVPMLADVCVLKCEPLAGSGSGEFEARIDAVGQHVINELTPAAQRPVGLAEAMRQAAAESRRVWLTAGGELGDPPRGVVLPLQARGRMIASLALLREPGRAVFTPEDVTMVEAYASRAAIALDNALLHEELHRADRQKTDFLSMLAHELRNPLSPIRNAAQLLALRATDEPDLKWICDVLDRQVTQMVRLVDDLLDISRITKGKIQLKQEPVELATVVAHAVEASRPLIDSRRHQLAVALPSQPVWIQGDPARLAQVLTNLLNNSAKYTEEEGQIWLSARNEGDSAIITVRDTGIGIPPQMLSAVFELFTQVDRTLDRSQGGLGIGLTLVRQLVEMHGGSVVASSNGPGTGAEFTVRLPVLKGLMTQQGPLPGQAPEERSLKVLIVDDNVDSAETLATLMRLVGHRVQVAYDGPTALEMARSFEPSAVILDIGLPGMDGFAVAGHLRQHEATKSALIIAVSGYGQEQDRTRSRQAQMDHHFVKPVEFTDLQSLLMQHRPAEVLGLHEQ